MLQTETINNLSTTYTKGNFDHIILWIAGGSLTGGKQQFKEWQENLLSYNIGSVAFDFPGIGDTPGSVQLSSLESRIHLTQLMILWITQELKPKKISVYGISMGGYVALASTHSNRHVNGTVIIQAPAAYAQEAHDKRFNSEFTHILRKEKSYEDSYSFEWLQDIPNKVVLISHTQDQVIPKDIIDRYKEIGVYKDYFIHKEIDAGHRIWDEDQQSAKNTSFEIIKNILI